MEAKRTPLSASIYHLYHPNSRRLILLACAGIAILTPFTDTIYLPALASVADSFDANDTMVALTVSIYLACVGIGQLIWGPLSDYYGRISVLYITLFVFEAFTIGCVFVTTIDELIILRSIEGLVVGSTVVSAQAIISDVFAMDERGTAMAYFLVSLLPLCDVTDKLTNVWLT
jgi:DHA1 family bicyclomycin/chloramphenicol resistance-like MFS transporter